MTKRSKTKQNQAYLRRKTEKPTKLSNFKQKEEIMQKQATATKTKQNQGKVSKTKKS